ncbi:MAG: ribose 5-phosphate isomerase B [Anaerolineae bacterium]|nr:ribose 5-phosphate isomerase B [Anaerolineae bacterium]MCB0205811.1 ribose 5-phosphate isomerase B [Anaerolineae bacterium]
MRIAVAADHGGFPLKEIVKETIRAAGHEPVDLGTDSLERVDFPDYAVKVGQVIKAGDAERGILICGSGVGVCVAANKIRGLYAGVCHDTYSAHQAVEHDNMNVLCLGARIVGVEVARELVTSFLSATYLNTGNYAHRVEKIIELEKQL